MANRCLQNLFTFFYFLAFGNGTTILAFKVESSQTLFVIPYIDVHQTMATMASPFFLFPHFSFHRKPPTFQQCTTASPFKLFPFLSLSPGKFLIS